MHMESPWQRKTKTLINKLREREREILIFAFSFAFCRSLLFSVVVIYLTCIYKC